MVIRFVRTLLIAAALATMTPVAGIPQTRDTATAKPDEISTILANLRETAHMRDSLTQLAESTGGEVRDLLDEQIWQRQTELRGGVLDLVARLKQEASRGRDLTGMRSMLGKAVRQEWPKYRVQVERKNQALAALRRSREAASGAQRLVIESRMTDEVDRLIEIHQYIADVILALNGIGVDVSAQRESMIEALTRTSGALSTRIQLAARERAQAGARLTRDPSNAELKNDLDLAEERFKRAERSLSAAIDLMGRLGLETTDLRVMLVRTTGRVTADVFQGKVLLGMARSWWTGFVRLLAERAPQWLFQGLLIVLTFVGFRTLANLVRRVVRRAVQFSEFSLLLRSTIVRLSGHAVMLIGFIVILTQLGVHVGPLLAGFGVAGIVVGFALQNTLSNFAAGGMILGNRPYDVGDDIEAAGVSGIVKRMSFVSTTILTPDNQTLIVPNSNIWGGVIRNRTAQPTRRVDLTFAIGYGDDLEKADRVLGEIVAGHEHVLKEPAPIIKVHQLADSSVNFVVRIWTVKDRYWDVYWDLTRSVKLRFDQEGISIPFPQRDVHLNIAKGGGADATVTLGAGPKKG